MSAQADARVAYLDMIRSRNTTSEARSRARLLCAVVVLLQGLETVQASQI